MQTFLGAMVVQEYVLLVVQEYVMLVFLNVVVVAWTGGSQSNDGLYDGSGGGNS